MRPAVKKWIVRPLVIIAITFVVLSIVVLIVLTTQQERIVNLALKELNQRTPGELTIESSSVSLFKHFPYVSIGLHEAKLYSDKTKTTKPICEIGGLYVGFSVPDLFRQKYDIRRLSLHDGYLNLVKEEDGEINILKAENMETDSTRHNQTDTTDLQINLQKISLKQMNISYLDRTTGRKFNTFVDKLSSSFSVAHQLMKMDLSTNLLLDYTTTTDTSFFRHKKIELQFHGDYKKAVKLFEVSSCSLRIQDAFFIVEGSADLANNPNLDLRIKGDKPDLNLITAFLPGDVKTALRPFKYDGRLYFDGTIKGVISKDEMPLIDVSFGCEDGWFLNTGVDKKVDQLGFKGYYTNGAEHSLKTSELHITNVSARPEKGIFQGNFVMRDFTEPKTLIQIRSELELKFLGDFLGIKDLQQITGKIKLDMDFKEFSDIDLPEQSLNKLKEGVQSKLIVEGLTFNIPGYPHVVRNMNLQAEMKDGKITVDSASLRIGESDLSFDGHLDDVRAVWRDRDKLIHVSLNARSRRIVLPELLSYDTALSNRLSEEIHRFNIGLTMETTVNELLHPSPLPEGKFEMKNLNASFKNYPHSFQNMNASLTVGDTTLRLHNLTGMIDKSDLLFSGRINNFHLWFNQFKIGRTQIAFDFKSTRFAMEDILGPAGRKYLPRGYRREEANNVWLRAKVDLRYDTVFKFAKAHIANITGTLKKHALQLKDIKGNVKYGARVLILDTLTGTIGKSDFDISCRLFNGPDRQMRKRTNSFSFKSKFLDADELSNLKLAPTTGKKKDSTSVATVPAVDTTSHAKSFNIFTIPFSDFKVRVDIAKVKYNKLWLKDVIARVRMQEDHNIFVDTLGMKVADGALSLTGHLDGMDTTKIYFRSEIDVSQVDLEKVMIKLDHFGQDVVINKNIRGRLNGKIKSYVQMHPNFVPIVSKTTADLNIEIYNGSLVDFAPMQAMAAYFKDKNLRLVRFDTLKNQLTFTNGVLEIPNMNINSSLGYIQVSGKQSMDMNMEYYVRVPMKLVTRVGLNALFEGKTETVDAKQVDQIEAIDKDKKINFMNLKVTGTPNDFKVGLGKDKRN